MQAYHAHLSARTLIFYLQTFFRHIIMLTNLNCYLNQVFCPLICFCPLRNRGGEESRRYKILTIFGPLLYISDRFGPFWVYVCPFGQGKLLNRSRLYSSSRGFLIGCVLIPPPLGFLTTFFVQNLKFSKSFHMNPKLEFTKLFWTCKMTNTRRFYNCTFTLLNRESV